MDIIKLYEDKKFINNLNVESLARGEELLSIEKFVEKIGLKQAFNFKNNTCLNSLLWGILQGKTMTINEEIITSLNSNEPHDHFKNKIYNFFQEHYNIQSNESIQLDVESFSLLLDSLNTTHKITCIRQSLSLLESIQTKYAKYVDQKNQVDSERKLSAEEAKVKEMSDKNDDNIDYLKNESFNKQMTIRTEDIKFRYTVLIFAFDENDTQTAYINVAQEFDLEASKVCGYWYIMCRQNRNAKAGENKIREKCPSAKIIKKFEDIGNAINFKNLLDEMLRKGPFIKGENGQRAPYKLKTSNKEFFILANGKNDKVSDETFVELAIECLSTEHPEIAKLTERMRNIHPSSSQSTGPTVSQSRMTDYFEPTE